MLTVYDHSSQFQRRDFLQMGALGGLGLTGLLSGTDALAQSPSSIIRGKSVVFLFLHGGPSQIETFDPKMTAPSEIRSVTGELATAIPGVTFGGTFPKLAQLADQFSIVRSFTTGNGNHDIKPIVCSQTLNSNMGSLYSRMVGANNPVTGMPTNVALYPNAVDATTRPANMNFGKFGSTGTLGTAYQPFVPGSGGDVQKNMELQIPMDRLGERRHLLSTLDRLQWERDAKGTTASLDQTRDQAFRTILGGVADAFDLSKEDPKIVANYDTAPLVRPDQIDRKWRNYNNYVDNAKSLGKLMLMARRLCEKGAGFVTVTTNFVWDMHADVNNATIIEGMNYMGQPLDHAVSVFLQDVADRGLSDDILLVVCGEMGRTPRINKKGGRDHWGNLAPLMLAGGGLQSGQVIGQSTRDVGQPLSEPITIDHLVSTIMHTLFDLGELRLVPGIPNDISRLLSQHEPIPGLL